MALKYAFQFAGHPVFQGAWARFEACDGPAGEADAVWGLWPAPPVLTSALLPGLADLPRTDVFVSGVVGLRPGGRTRLYAGPPLDSNPDDLTRYTADELRAWLTAHPEPRLSLLVEVTTTPRGVFEGAIVEILNHEMAAHAEPFADFLIDEAKNPGSGVLGTADEQHAQLVAGNPRYQLIAARYLTTYRGADEADRYRVRRLQDPVAVAALPDGV